MHKGHRTLVKLLLLELHTLDILITMALYTWYSRVLVSAICPTVFKVKICNLQQSKNIGGLVIYIESLPYTYGTIRVSVSATSTVFKIMI